MLLKSLAISVPLFIVCLVACIIFTNSTIPEECGSLELYMDGTVAEYIASVDAIGVCDDNREFRVLITTVFPMATFCISFCILLNREPLE